MIKSQLTLLALAHCVNRLKQGAPASLFISADEKNMKMLQDKDLVTNVNHL